MALSAGRRAAPPPRGRPGWRSRARAGRPSRSAGWSRGSAREISSSTEPCVSHELAESPCASPLRYVPSWSHVERVDPEGALGLLARPRASTRARPASAAGSAGSTRRSEEGADDHHRRSCGTMNASRLRTNFVTGGSLRLYVTFSPVVLQVPEVDEVVALASPRRHALLDRELAIPPRRSGSRAAPPSTAAASASGSPLASTESSATRPKSSSNSGRFSFSECSSPPLLAETNHSSAA